MKICIPTSDQKGLDSAIHGHFGSAPQLAVIDLASMTIEFLVREPSADPSAEPSGGCASASVLRGQPVQAVFCQAMGQGALATLESQGIPVYATQATTLKEALLAIRDDEVRRLGAAEACGGHQPGHGHGGGCCGGH